MRASACLTGLFSSLTAVVLASGPAAPRQAATTAAVPASADAASYWAVLNQYCVNCHNQRLKTGGLTLETLDLGRIPADAETWEKVVRKLRAGAMPPQGVKRPDPATYHALDAWLEGELD